MAEPDKQNQNQKQKNIQLIQAGKQNMFWFGIWENFFSSSSLVLQKIRSDFVANNKNNNKQRRQQTTLTLGLIDNQLDCLSYPPK